MDKKGKERRWVASLFLSSISCYPSWKQVKMEEKSSHTSNTNLQNLMIQRENRNACGEN